MQLMPIHADLIHAVGCSTFFDARCNIAAAAMLYRDSGSAPWRL
jgi:hypothetical protein